MMISKCPTPSLSFWPSFQSVYNPPILSLLDTANPKSLSWLSKIGISARLIVNNVALMELWLYLVLVLSTIFLAEPEVESIPN